MSIFTTRSTHAHTHTYMAHTHTHPHPAPPLPPVNHGSGNLKQVKQRKAFPPSRRQHSALTQDPSWSAQTGAWGLPAAAAGYRAEERPARWWQLLPVSQKGRRVHGLSSYRSLINTMPDESVADAHYPGVLQVGRL